MRLEDTKNKLKMIARKISVTGFIHYSEYLVKLYADAKTHIENYSYLKFAEDLGFSATNVIRLVINGSRPLTSKAAEKIAIALDLHGAERRYWTQLVRYNNARSPDARESAFRLLMSNRSKAAPKELEARDLQYFNEWYHPVIRELVGLPSCDGTPEWIRDHLSFPLRLENIKASLELLASLRMIAWDEKAQRYVRTSETIRTDTEVDSLAIVRYHQKMIEIGKESITQINEHERDIRALTVALPESALPLLKAKIQMWMQEILAMEDKDRSSRNRVFQMNMQLFPFSKRG